MEWIDIDHIKGELSDQEFMNRINILQKDRDQKRYGRDGAYEVYSENFNYRGIVYTIKILRYYVLDEHNKVILNKGRINGINKWAVLEYSEESEELVKLVQSLPYPVGNREFLWGDTLHFGQEHWSLYLMVEQMHKDAKESIDEMIDNTDFKLFRYIQSLLEKVNTIKSIIHSKELK